MKFLNKLNFEVNTNSNSKALIWMALGGFSFATMGAFAHALGETCDWMLIAFFRMLLTFIFVSYLAAHYRIIPFLLNRPLLWFRSLMGSAAMLATFYALTHLPISDVAVVTETRPIMVALLAGYLIGERSGGKLWIILIISLVGVLLIEQPHFRTKNFAVFVAFFAAFAGAVVMICLRQLRDIDPRVIVTHFSGTATIITFLSIIIFRNDIDLSVLRDSTIIMMLLGVGVMGTIGQLAMTKAFAIGEAPNVSAAGYVKIGFAATYDILIWKQSFGPITITAMALILILTAWLFHLQRKTPKEIALPENTTSF